MSAHDPFEDRAPNGMHTSAMAREAWYHEPLTAAEHASVAQAAAEDGMICENCGDVADLRDPRVAAFHATEAARPPACGLCGGANALSKAFVPEALSAREHERSDELIAGPTCPEREALALDLCGECWPYGLEARADDAGEREALQALVERTGRAELQDYGISEALRACLVAADERAAWTGTSRWRLETPAESRKAAEAAAEWRR